MVELNYYIGINYYIIIKGEYDAQKAKELKKTQLEEIREIIFNFLTESFETNALDEWFLEIPDKLLKKVRITKKEKFEDKTSSFGNRWKNYIILEYDYVEKYHPKFVKTLLKEFTIEKNEQVTFLVLEPKSKILNEIFELRQNMKKYYLCINSTKLGLNIYYYQRRIEIPRDNIKKCELNSLETRKILNKFLSDKPPNIQENFIREFLKGTFSLMRIHFGYRDFDEYFEFFEGDILNELLSIQNFEIVSWKIDFGASTDDQPRFEKILEQINDKLKLNQLKNYTYKNKESEKLNLILKQQLNAIRIDNFDPLDPDDSNSLIDEFNKPTSYPPSIFNSVFGVDESDNITDLHIVKKNLKQIPEIIKRLRNLERLNLQWNRIQDINHIENLQELTELNLSYNRINKINDLKNLKHLKHLNLKMNYIDDINEIRDIQKQLPEISINIDHNPLKEGEKEMFEFLERVREARTVSVYIFSLIQLLFQIFFSTLKNSFLISKYIKFPTSIDYKYLDINYHMTPIEHLLKTVGAEFANLSNNLKEVLLHELTETKSTEIKDTIKEGGLWFCSEAERNNTLLWLVTNKAFSEIVAIYLYKRYHGHYKYERYDKIDHKYDIYGQRKEQLITNYQSTPPDDVLLEMSVKIVQHGAVRGHFEDFIMDYFESNNPGDPEHVMYKFLLTLIDKEIGLDIVRFELEACLDKFAEDARNKILLKLVEKNLFIWIYAKIVIKNFDIIPEEIRDLLFTLTDKGPPVEVDIAGALVKYFEDAPEKVRSLLFKLAKRESNAKTIALAIILKYDYRYGINPNYKKFSKELINLLFKLAETEVVFNQIVLEICKHYYSLPEDIKNQLLLKLTKQEAAVAEIVKNHDKIPENVRKEILQKLAEKKKEGEA